MAVAVDRQGAHPMTIPQWLLAGASVLFMGCVANAVWSSMRKGKPMTTELDKAKTEEALGALFKKITVEECELVLGCLQSIANERNEALGRVKELELELVEMMESRDSHFNTLQDFKSERMDSMEMGNGLPNRSGEGGK